MEVVGIQDGIGNDPVAIFEAPAAFAHEPVDDRQADRLFETLEGAHDEGGMRPWAGIGDIEMVAPGFSLEAAFAGRAGRAVGCYPIAEQRGRPFETATGSGCVVPLVVPSAFDEASHD